MNVSCPNTAMFISGTVWVANASCLEQRQLPKLGNVQPCLDQFYSFLNSWSLASQLKHHQKTQGGHCDGLLGCLGVPKPLLECPNYRYILKAKGTPCTRGRSTRWTTWAWSWSSTTSVTTPDTRGSGGKSWGTFSRHEEGFYVFICVLYSTFRFLTWQYKSSKTTDFIPLLSGFFLQVSFVELALGFCVSAWVQDSSGAWHSYRHS